MREPRFGELYVVSDLHIGDTRGQPIFDQAKELADFIGCLTKKGPSADGPIGLVLNGDVFDTLPEPMKGYVCDREQAESVILSIVESEAFACVFQALQAYVAEPGHQLVFVLGNHDLELIYPNVQQSLLEFLCAPSSAPPGALEARSGRVTFATVGTGFRCRVGSAADAVSVACVHGNEFDDWNAFDPETLTRLARAGTLGCESELTLVAPNSGTKLVRDVMNGVKAKYPFVDLLKPEQEGVFSILLAIAPDELRRVPGFLKTVVSSVTVGAYRVARVLGADGAPTAEPVAPSARPEGAGKWAPSGAFARFLEQAPASSLLQEAWTQALADEVRPEELALGDEVLGKGRLALNLLDYYVRRITQSPNEALQAALKDWGGAPETWQPDGQCDVFDQLAKLEPDADVLVAGHTHLRRQKRLPASGTRGRPPLYLNTGTWIRLIRLDQGALDPPNFEALLRALKSKSMNDIDLLPDGMLLRQKTVAVIRRSAAGPFMEAAICDFMGAGAPSADTFKAVQSFETVQRG